MRHAGGWQHARAVALAQRAEREAKTADPTAPPPKQTKQHSSANQRNRAKRGRAGEEKAKVLHEACVKAKVALVHRVPSEMNIKGTVRPGVFLATFGDKATVDFLGIMTDRSRRAVAVEVKRLPPDGKKFSLTEVTPGERAVLDTYLDEGHVAVLLLVDGAIASYAVPWATAKTQRTWGRVELRTYCIPAGDPDYLKRF